MKTCEFLLNFHPRKNMSCMHGIQKEIGHACRSSSEGVDIRTSKGGGKHNSLSQSPDLAELNPKIVI